MRLMYTHDSSTRDTQWRMNYYSLEMPQPDLHALAMIFITLLSSGDPGDAMNMNASPVHGMHTQLKSLGPADLVILVIRLSITP
jgi:hypothetical protein